MGILFLLRIIMSFRARADGNSVITAKNSELFIEEKMLNLFFFSTEDFIMSMNGFGIMEHKALYNRATRNSISQHKKNFDCKCTWTDVNRRLFFAQANRGLNILMRTSQLSCV